MTEDENDWRNQPLPTQIIIWVVVIGVGWLLLLGLYILTLWILQAAPTP